MKTLHVAGAVHIEREIVEMIDILLNTAFVAYNIAIGVWLVAIAWRDLK